MLHPLANERYHEQTRRRRIRIGRRPPGPAETPLPEPIGVPPAEPQNVPAPNEPIGVPPTNPPEIPVTVASRCRPQASSRAAVLSRGERRSGPSIEESDRKLITNGSVVVLFFPEGGMLARRRAWT